MKFSNLLVEFTFTAAVVSAFQELGNLWPVICHVPGPSASQWAMALFTSKCCSLGPSVIIISWDCKDSSFSPVLYLVLMSRSQLAVLGDMTSRYSSSLRMLLMMEGFCTCECTSTSWFVCRGHKVWAKPTPQELLPSSWVKKWTRCSCTRSCTSLFPKVSNSWELNGQLWKSNCVIRENWFSVKLLNLFYR